MFKQILFSVIITSIIFAGLYWIDRRDKYPGDEDVFFSFVEGSFMLLAFGGATAMAILYGLNRYFNRFLCILIITIVVAANISYMLSEHIRSASAYFDSWPAFMSLAALVALVALFIIRAFTPLRRRQQSPN